MEVIINLKHVHKPYLAVKKNEAGNYETIAGGDKYYMMKKYDIVIENITFKVLKGKLN